MELEGSPIYDELKEIQNIWFSSLEELIENKDDIICYSDCDFMEDLARYYVEESGQIGDVPANLQNYTDYQSLGRDMELYGNYLITSHEVIEYCN